MATFIPHFRLAKLMNTHEVQWPVETVQELLEYGVKEFGLDFQKEFKQATITVNGRAIPYLKGFKTPLSDADEVWSVLSTAD